MDDRECALRIVTIRSHNLWDRAGEISVNFPKLQHFESRFLNGFKADSDSLLVQAGFSDTHDASHLDRTGIATQPDRGRAPPKNPPHPIGWFPPLPPVTYRLIASRSRPEG